MKDEREIFLSYPSAEVKLARRVVEVIQEQGVSVWWDEGNRSDPAYGTVSEILLHLMEPLLLGSKYLVVIATGAAFASDWVPMEVSSFLDSKRPVIVWHPSDDDFNPLPFRRDMNVEAFQKIVNLMEHEDVIAHYDLPRHEVDTVARNIALLVRFFRFVEEKDKKVNKKSVSCYWEEFVDSVRNRGK